MKMSILLFISVANIVSRCASARIHSDNNLSQKLTIPITNNVVTESNKLEHDILKETYFLPLNKELNYYQYEGKLKLDHTNSELHKNNIKCPEVLIFLKSPSSKLLFGLSRKDKLGNKKRNINDMNVVRKRSIPKRKQKKAKILGHLLRNNVSSKNYEDIQDDYTEDEDDDYFKGVNRKKMKWEDFRNEDGASVMELIALNARHKTNMHHTGNNN